MSQQSQLFNAEPADLGQSMVVLAADLQYALEEQTRSLVNEHCQTNLAERTLSLAKLSTSMRVDLLDQHLLQSRLLQSRGSPHRAAVAPLPRSSCKLLLK